MTNIVLYCICVFYYANSLPVWFDLICVFFFQKCRSSQHFNLSFAYRYYFCCDGRLCDFLRAIQFSDCWIKGLIFIMYTRSNRKSQYPQKKNGNSGGTDLFIHYMPLTIERLRVWPLWQTFPNTIFINICFFLLLFFILFNSVSRNGNRIELLFCGIAETFLFFSEAIFPLCIWIQMCTMYILCTEWIHFLRLKNELVQH